MPVNFQQALNQIRTMGQQAIQQQQKLQELRDQADQLFIANAEELMKLEKLVDDAAAINTHLRCARPFAEALNQTFPTPPATPPYTLLAADGSQIHPDRHAMVEFGAINIGAIRVQPGSANPAEEVVQSQMMFHNDLFTASGNYFTEEIVALKRDLAERQALSDLARQENGPVVALTDGPLELFREPQGMPEYKQEINRYLDVMEDLADRGVVAAGYVDRPRGDLVIRLLELALLDQRGQFNKAGEERPLRGVFDSHLFYTLLQPGQRSAVFAIHSGSLERFRGRLSLHFFYLNVGSANHTYLSRVEIPRWVAENAELLDLLHACLVLQARHLGARPYPYVLHRAHEIAVVSFTEASQLENMIVAELRRQGVAVDDFSNKQIAKNASRSRAR